MRLEVVMQLPPGDQDDVQELLDLGITSLGIRKDFANEVYGMLHLEGMSLFFAFYHQCGTDHLRGGHNVKQEWFPISRGTKIRAFIRISLTLSSAS